MGAGLANQKGGDGLPSPEAVEAAVINGDLERLSPEYRVKWYQMRCEAAGLNSMSRPFEYIRLSGKLTLYATKSCTDQLSGIHGLSHSIISRETMGDVHVVTVEVKGASGRSTQDIGAVAIGGLKGEALCNALMKTVTKAKRRATLSLCGLGDVIDESELDTVRNVQRCTPTGEVLPDAHHAKNFAVVNDSGHGSGAYARPEVVKEYQEWARTFAEGVNLKWLDHVQVKHGLDRAKDLLNDYQLRGHLYKWGASEGLFDAPAEKRSSGDKYAAIAFDRDPQAVEAEATRYCHELWRKAAAAALAGPADDDREPASAYEPEYREEPEPRPQPTQQPRQRPAGNGSAPRSGKALFAWAKEQGDANGVDVIEIINGWGKLRKLPALMIEWSADDVAGAHAEAVEFLAHNGSAAGAAR